MVNEFGGCPAECNPRFHISKELCSGCRTRRGRRKLRIAKNGDKVLNLCDFRRLKQSGESRKRLQGLNYPLDHLVGPDESSEGFGFLPPQENMDWLKRMMEEEGEE
jgi:hypothetical protein